MLGPSELPWAVTGERCAILEKPPAEMSAGGIYYPAKAKERYWSGRLIDAGLQARAKLYDNGYEIGDEVEFGRYAGLREAWDHVTDWGRAKPGMPDEAFKWEFDKGGSNDSRSRYVCANTGAVRDVESIIVLNSDDLIASVELARRLREGNMRMARGKDPEGKTVFFIERAA